MHVPKLLALTMKYSTTQISVYMTDVLMEKAKINLVLYNVHVQVKITTRNRNLRDGNW